jgi:hypothetical protein
MFKFRTMVVNAEQEGEARWAVRGDLSLVGPRAERPEFVERLQHEIPFYRAPCRNSSSDVVRRFWFSADGFSTTLSMGGVSFSRRSPGCVR